MPTLKTIEARLIPSEWFPPTQENPESIAVASEAARQFALQLSIVSTKLCQELNGSIGQHEDFETWKADRSIPPATLKSLWNLARSQPPFAEMPERFTRSAWLRIESIYSSWFKTQSKLLAKLNGLNRWLGIIKSDQKLVEISQYQLDQIRERASQILSETKKQLEKQAKAANREDKSSKKSKKAKKTIIAPANSTTTQPTNESDKDTKKEHRLSDELFATYFTLVETDGSILDRCAIIHLLKNGCSVAVEPENLRKFAETCATKRKQAQRIEEQLAARLPRLRDLGEEVSNALAEGVQIVPSENARFAAQLANLQRKSNPLPYPVLFYSGDDVEWYLIPRKHPVSQNIEKRIFVKFKGLNTYFRQQVKKQIAEEIQEHLAILRLSLGDVEWKIARRKSKADPAVKDRIVIKLKRANPGLKKQVDAQLAKIDLKKYEIRKQYLFEVCCDRRQLQYFQVFLSDWQTYISDENLYPITLFAFRSAALLWRRSTQNGIDTFQPYLQCTFDHERLTAERAELARIEEISKVNQSISSYEAKVQGGVKLTENQQKNLEKTRGQLAALSHPFPRVSKPLYQGNSNLIVSVSFSREQVATLAVVDCSTQKAIAYRSIRQLLGKNYKLLSAYRLTQGRNANERRKQQKRGKVSTLSESDQGKYIDRLIAKAIVEVIQEFKAGSLALPNLIDLRESLQSELEAKAEWEYPRDKAKQKNYEKQYKISVHRWSYARLTQSIRERTGKVGIPVEQGQQPRDGNFKEKALQVAWSAYQNREDGESERRSCAES